MNNKLPGTIATSQSDFETFTHPKTNIKSMRERTVEDLLSRELDVFENAIADENKVLAICSREEIWNIVYRIVEQEIEKEREEIVEMVSKEFDRQSESCTKFGHEPILYLPDTKRIIINTIKNRV